MEKNHRAKFRLIGLELDQKTTNEDNRSSTDCGSLWQKFQRDKVFDLIPNKLTNEVYAVYFDYEQDETKPFSYFIGCVVDEHAEIPSNLTSLEIPAQDYVVVKAKGVMTGCITEAWTTIWNAQIPRKFGFDFEVYDERSQDWNDAEVDIYVSIK